MFREEHGGGSECKKQPYIKLLIDPLVGGEGGEDPRQRGVDVRKSATHDLWRSDAVILHVQSIMNLRGVRSQLDHSNSAKADEGIHSNAQSKPRLYCRTR